MGRSEDAAPWLFYILGHGGIDDTMAFFMEEVSKSDNRYEKGCNRRSNRKRNRVG